MAIIKCPECGHQTSDKAPVCPNCGVEIAGKIIKCPYCGEIYLKSEVVCPHCHKSALDNSAATSNDNANTNDTSEVNIEKDFSTSKQDSIVNTEDKKITTLQNNVEHNPEVNTPVLNFNPDNHNITPKKKSNKTIIIVSLIIAV